MRNLIFLAAVWFLAGPQGSLAEDVAVVLSSDSAPYREAFGGFQETFGKKVLSFNLARQEPNIGAGTKVVVTFGAKAASRDYPEHVIVIYGLAPGFKRQPEKHSRLSVKVRTTPPAGTVVERLREIQPSLKRLAVFWVSESYLEYIQEIQRSCQAVGSEALTERMSGPEQLPARLRSLTGKIDAIWILPDPLLINTQSFATLKDFSWANRVPLYVPTTGLAENGAAAAVACSFREIGHTAAKAAILLLSGKTEQRDFYPEHTQVIINNQGAVHSGLRIPPEILKKSDKVIP